MKYNNKFLSNTSHLLVYIMKFKDPENIYEALQPIYYIYKFFGLFPFSFAGPIKHGELQFKFYDKLWSATVLLIHLVVIAFTVRDLDNPPKVWTSKIVQIMLKANLMLGVLGSFFNSINHCMNKDRVKSFLKILERFDEQVLQTSLNYISIN